MHSVKQAKVLLGKIHELRKGWECLQPMVPAYSKRLELKDFPNSDSTVLWKCWRAQFGGIWVRGLRPVIPLGPKSHQTLGQAGDSMAAVPSSAADEGTGWLLSLSSHHPALIPSVKPRGCSCWKVGIQVWWGWEETSLVLSNCDLQAAAAAILSLNTNHSHTAEHPLGWLRWILSNIPFLCRAICQVERPTDSKEKGGRYLVF